MRQRIAFGEDMRNTQLMQEFDILTDNKYTYIRLVEVNFAIYRNLAEYVLLYPSVRHIDVEANKVSIESHLSKLLASTFETSIVLRQSHFDARLLVPEILKYLKGYVAIASFVRDSDIVVHDLGNDHIKLEIHLQDSVSEYAKSSGLVDKIKSYLYYRYTNDFDVVIVARQLTQAEQDDIDNRQQARQYTNVSLLEENNTDRSIIVSNIRHMLGREIETDCASYIVDSKVVCDDVVLCGTLTVYNELVAKSTGKKFFKFVLQDFTDSVNGVLFGNKATIELLPQLKQGDTVICRGKIELDKFANNGSVVFYPKDISYCALPTDFKLNRIIMQVPEYYTTIEPQAWVQQSTPQIQEIDFFGIGGQDVSLDTVPSVNSNPQLSTNPQLQDTEYVVFDIETTGLDEETCTIIEIAAVKIIKGNIVQSWSTLIDPKVELPRNIVELTGITQDMLSGKPTLNQVLPDLYKFCHGCTLVAHNIEFDIRFVRHYAVKCNIYFDNPTMDTLAMSRQKLKGLKNHKLGTICAHLGIVNNSAHRALSDTVATAELYLHLVNM